LPPPPVPANCSTLGWVLSGVFFEKFGFCSVVFGLLWIFVDFLWVLVSEFLCGFTQELRILFMFEIGIFILIYELDFLVFFVAL
jgi:hypothetical protein